jgi:hypothetical protein
MNFSEEIVLGNLVIIIGDCLCYFCAEENPESTSSISHQLVLHARLFQEFSSERGLE